MYVILESTNLSALKKQNMKFYARYTAFIAIFYNNTPA